MILTEEEIEELKDRPFSQNDWLWFYTRAIEAKIIEKIGKPVVWAYSEHGETVFGHPDGYHHADAIPLYKLTEVKE